VVCNYYSLRKDNVMDIRTDYNYICESKLPKRKSFLNRIRCKHQLVDNILIGESGLSRISREDHIVYCEKCGHIEGYYSKEYY